MSEVRVNQVVSPNQIQATNPPAIELLSNTNISIDTDVVYVDSVNDRVGFGTTSPSKTLEFSGPGGVVFSGGAIFEPVNITGAAVTSSTYHDLEDGNIAVYTAPSSNWTYNVRFNSTTTLNSTMSTGQTVFLVAIVPVGASSSYPTGFDIDGSAITVEWNDAATPTQAGNNDEIATTGYDLYSYQIIKTGDAAWTVFGSQNHFGDFV